jgi:hypothetical protein
MSITDNEAPSPVGTDFQLHVNRESKNIIDYTEQKLKRFARSIKDPQQKQSVQDLMDRHIDGSIAICWKKGYPAWLQIK